jgi:transketolase
MDNKINVKLLSMVGQGGSAFGITLMELMKKRDDIMVLSADMSTPAGLDKFKSSYPDHFMNVGIAEQNMIGIAAGLADEGYKVICVAQACFITMRCFEQVRQYTGYMGIPMVLIGIGSGLSLQYMGNTHYALEDFALMHTIPNMTVDAPCDALEACKALECAISSNGSTYIRLFGGTGVPVVHTDNVDYELGKAITLRDGNDIAILACGSMVKQAIEVADALTEKGIECEVIDVHTVIPFDNEALRSCSEKKLIVTLEEHRVNGGLGSIVAERLKEKQIDVKFLKMGIKNFYPLPGSYPYMLDQCGLSAEKISSSIINNIR